MKILQSISDFTPGARYLAVALGNFDGLHRGHAELIRRAAERAAKQGGAVMLLSFWPHPMSVLGKEPPLLLASRQEKRRQAENLGVDYFLELPFTAEFAAQSPADFVRGVLAAGLSADLLSVGFNFHFGAGGAGDAAELKRLAAAFGMETLVLPPYELDGEPVSSSRIRELLAAGQMRQANRLLGRCFALQGTVTQGRQLGRQLGFPTANMQTEADLQLPAYGVYAAVAEVGGGRYPAVVNIGLRPTVGDFDAPTVEAHILSGLAAGAELYGAAMRLEFAAEIRPERKFDSLAELQAQIAKDKITALELLQKNACNLPRTVI